MSQLGSLLSPDLADSDRLLIVPLGATEQHGPHLPLSTDTTIAQALADELAARRPAVVAPALPYGSSGEHQSFSGTLSIGLQAMQSVLIELVRSATETFSRVLLLSAHGGNLAAINRATVQLRAEHRDVLAWTPARVWQGDAHAGQIETSVMLALAPEAVFMLRAQVGNTAPLAELMPQLVGGGVQAVSTNGVLGDPTAATMQQGQQLIEAAVSALETFIDQWPNLEG